MSTTDRTGRTRGRALSDVAASLDLSDHDLALARAVVSNLQILADVAESRALRLILNEAADVLRSVTFSGPKGV